MNRDSIAHEVLNVVVLVVLTFAAVQVFLQLGIIVPFQALVLIGTMSPGASKKSGYGRRDVGRGGGNQPWKEVRRGWVWVTEEFLDRVVELAVGAASGARRESHVRRGALARHDGPPAQRMLQHGLGVLGLMGVGLGGSRKSDGGKQALAWWLRKRTALTSQWVPERLCMGHSCNIGRAVAAVESGSERLAAHSGQELIECKDSLS